MHYHKCEGFYILNNWMNAVILHTPRYSHNLQLQILNQGHNLIHILRREVSADFRQYRIFIIWMVSAFRICLLQD